MISTANEPVDAAMFLNAYETTFLARRLEMHSKACDIYSY
jgi:hypothetical protein